jgi:hypothetical protein
MNEITKEKIRVAHLGKKASLKTRQIMRLSHLGIRQSEETKQKIRLANIGKKLSSETKEKVRHANIGKHHSKETINKLRLINIGRTGANAGNWKGGKTTLIRSIRASLKYSKWAALCRTRDFWTCRECNEHSKDLNVHHKYSFLDIIKNNNILTLDEAMNCSLLWDLNNGVTLCCDCHRKIHSYLKILARETKNLRPLIVYDQIVERRLN